jgi:hypothetical protein
MWLVRMGRSSSWTVRHFACVQLGRQFSSVPGAPTWFRHSDQDDGIGRLACTVHIATIDGDQLQTVTDAFRSLDRPLSIALQPPSPQCTAPISTISIDHSAAPLLDSCDHDRTATSSTQQHVS